MVTVIHTVWLQKQIEPNKPQLLSETSCFLRTCNVYLKLLWNVYLYYMKKMYVNKKVDKWNELLHYIEDRYSALEISMYWYKIKDLSFKYVYIYIRYLLLPSQCYCLTQQKLFQCVVCLNYDKLSSIQVFVCSKFVRVY